MNHLRAYAIEFMVTEAKTNTMCAHHIKRKTAISKLGLDGDDVLDSPMAKAVPMYGE